MPTASTPPSTRSCRSLKQVLPCACPGWAFYDRAPRSRSYSKYSRVAKCRREPMPAKSKAVADALCPSPPVKDLASARHVAAVIRTCLQEGHRVEIERLGEFRPVNGGGFRFVPESRPSVFLAYVSEDAAKVEHLCEILESAGFDAWMDRRRLL